MVQPNAKVAKVNKVTDEKKVTIKAKSRKKKATYKITVKAPALSQKAECNSWLKATVKLNGTKDQICIQQ